MGAKRGAPVEKLTIKQVALRGQEGRGKRIEGKKRWLMPKKVRKAEVQKMPKNAVPSPRVNYNEGEKEEKVKNH